MAHTDNLCVIYKYQRHSIKDRLKNVSVKNNDRKRQPAKRIDDRTCPQVERNIDQNYNFASASPELDRRREILTLNIKTAIGNIDPN